MTTQTKSNPIIDSIETATEKVAALSETAVEHGKRSSSVLIDSYEKTVVALADSYVKAARSTNAEWFSTIADVQADFAREGAKSYAGAARTLIG
ncbi:MAG: hypothetical protein ACYDHH_21890 [Solirubrobacteraceae bacterium]